MTKEKYRKDITNERFGRLVALYNGFYVEYFGGDIE